MQSTPEAKKKLEIFFVNFFLSPVAGQAVDVGASRAGRLPCSESISLSIRSKKKVKIFLSPVAGQVVDVGASRAGGAALLRVDLAFDPIEKKK